MEETINLEETKMLMALFDWYDKYQNVNLFDDEYYNNLFTNLVIKTDGKILNALPDMYCAYRKFKKQVLLQKENKYGDEDESFHSYIAINEMMNDRYKLKGGLKPTVKGTVDLFKKGSTKLAPHIQTLKTTSKNKFIETAPHVKKGFLDAIKEMNYEKKGLTPEKATEPKTQQHWAYDLTKSATKSAPQIFKTLRQVTQ